MLRRFHSIAATVASVCALAGCSSSAPSDATSSSAQAVTTVGSLCNGRGGTATVNLVSFDPSSLELTGFDDRGNYVVAHLTPSTREVLADLGAFPPDPIYPQCGNDAAAYDRVVVDGLTKDLLASLGALAADSCNATITTARGGAVVSFQPVP